MKKIYLAGGWSNWRDKVIASLDNCIWLDPRVAQDPTTGKEDADWFEQEVEMIRSCDGIICWIEKINPSGFGSTFEMGMSYALNKPYVLINEKEDKYQWSMQTKGAVVVVKTLEEALCWIKETGWLDLVVKF